ncbi:bacterial transcriptional activator domain-containing protein [Streptomyces syringium]|uniref:AfsR/SARP family transcriptional regulator n=1 Tax=Streptomyces syringium TaxID=76729 RepID=UPI0033B126E0
MPAIWHTHAPISGDITVEGNGRRLCLLGEDGIHVEGHGDIRLSLSSAELLAYLALRDGHWARRPAIIRAMWPDAPEQQGRRLLSRLLWRTNSDLPERLIEAEGELVSLTDGLTSDWEQALVVIESIEETDALPVPERAALLRRPLMAEVSASWADEQRAHWDRQRFHALLRVGQMLLADGHVRQAADTASFLTSWDPLDEPSHELLVRSLIGMGATGRAAESLRALDKRLRRELGVEADPQLFALLRQGS